MGAVALDASAVIALLSAADAHHEQAVAELQEALDRGEALSMAASAYSETMVHALRRRRGDLIDGLVADLRVEIVTIDREIGHEAAGLRATRRALRLPDALVLAAARARSARLLTFDRELAALAAKSDPPQS